MTRPRTLFAALLLSGCTQPSPRAVPPDQAIRAPGGARATPVLWPTPSFASTPSGFVLAGGEWAVDFEPDLVRLSHEVSVSTRSWGREGARRAPGKRTPEVAYGRLTYARDGLVEWWQPMRGAVEQGWQIHAPPGGAGELVLEVGVVGSEVATASDGRVALSALGQTDGWVVSGLRAWDANGHLLPARFEPQPGGFSIRIDDSSARYPIEIDPVYRYEDDYLDQSAIAYGTAIDGGGDVNADGFADVIVGSSGASDGRAWVYTGSTEGRLTLLVTLTDLDFQSQGRAAVAFADVNGDGYSDVVAGADAYDEALVFLGPELALTTRLQSSCRSPFGYVVANAGDTNADGYDDVIVGSPEWDDPDYGSGCVAVYFGSAGGLSGSPDLELRGQASNYDLRFGDVLAGLGDVNGDGFDEVGIASYETGETFVYAGSAAGPSDILNTVYLNSTVALDAAGDVNADGFADVVATSGTYGVEVFMGSAEGLGEPIPLPFGYAVAGGGDLGRDGYADVLTKRAGTAYIFAGGSAGLETEPSATVKCGSDTSEVIAGAGDVDGDGLDDVLTGGTNYSVCLFLGSTLAGPGETGVIETGAPSWPHPDTSPDTSESDDSAAGTDSDDTEEPGRSGKSGCAGGGCGGGSVSAGLVIVGLSGMRRRRTAPPHRRRKRRGAADS